MARKKKEQDIVVLEDTGDTVTYVDADTDKPVKNRILAMDVEGLVEEIVYEASEIADQYVSNGTINSTAFSLVVMDVRKKYGFSLVGINQTFDFNQDVVDRFECLLNAYLTLCAKYKHTASKVEYYTFCGVCKDTISGWRLETNQNVTSTASDFVQNLDKLFESILLGKVLDENSIGAMFNLKCSYGYVEQKAATQVQIANVNSPSISIADIRGTAALLESSTFDIADDE